MTLPPFVAGNLLFTCAQPAGTAKSVMKASTGANRLIATLFRPSFAGFDLPDCCHFALGELGPFDVLLRIEQ
jgi:hypothetical protein